jgi:hypothetical protein
MDQNPLRQKWHPHKHYAQAIGKSERTVRDWMDAGLIRSTKLGSIRLINEDHRNEDLSKLARGGNRNGGRG